MKFVVAGNYREYDQHIRKMGYNPNEYVFVSDVIQLRGRDTIEGFYLGSYKDRPDIEEIQQIIFRSKVHKFSASQTLPPLQPTSNNNGMGFAPTSIMLKNAGAWQIYDLKNDINNGEVK
jgi:hypothetical protein